mmetsp:Transcript_19010/g.31095  ORF Transcript_19010/g.31095 Transcript_19010/m.31095 type:complete len:388 (-) Transcript_19010:99-1262(-)
MTTAPGGDESVPSVGNVYVQGVTPGLYSERPRKKIRGDEMIAMSTRKGALIAQDQAGVADVTSDMVAQVLSQLPPDSRPVKVHAYSSKLNANSYGFNENIRQPNRVVASDMLLGRRLPGEVETVLSRKFEADLNEKKRVARANNDQSGPPLEDEVVFGKRKRKRKQLCTGGIAKAYKYPENEPFGIGLEKRLIDLVAPGGAELDSLKLQKLKDATKLLQETNQHILEPLTLYKKKELYELMASIAEVWKNSGKAAWKKRINKIRENARYRKAPRNGLDEKEKDEIRELQERIRRREEWEKLEKTKLKVAKSMVDSSRTSATLPIGGNLASNLRHHHERQQQRAQQALGAQKFEGLGHESELGEFSMFVNQQQSLDNTGSEGQGFSIL